MPGYVWTGGPTLQEDSRLGNVSWPSTDIGLTVVRGADGNWSTVQNASESDLAEYVFVLRGGRRASVPPSYYSELVAAGYGAYIKTNDEYSAHYIRTMEN